MVTGTLPRLASSRTRSRTYGVLIRRAEVRAPFLVYRRSAVPVKHDIFQLHNIAKWMQYRPDLIEGFLTGTRLDLTPLSNLSN